MPCTSDYLEPNDRERELQRAAKLLVYVRGKMGMTVTKVMREAAKDIYCRTDMVPNLCASIRLMTAEQKRSILWDGSNTKARDLADWWEKHQAADRARRAAERKAKRDAGLRKTGIAKLTPAERRALGVES